MEKQTSPIIYVHKKITPYSVLFILICEPPESFFVVQSHPLGTDFFVWLSYTVVEIKTWFHCIKMYLIVISKLNELKNTKLI